MAKRRYCGGSAALIGKYLAMRGGAARMRGEKDGRQLDDTPAPAREGDHPDPQPPAERRYPVADFDAFRPWLAAYQDDWFGWRTFGNTRLRDAGQFADWMAVYGNPEKLKLEVGYGR